MLLCQSIPIKLLHRNLQNASEIISSFTHHYNFNHVWIAFMQKKMVHNTSFSQEQCNIQRGQTFQDCYLAGYYVTT